MSWSSATTSHGKKMVGPLNCCRSSTTCSVRSAGDKDDDVWRTIQSWMDAHAPGDEYGPMLTLVTAQQAQAGYGYGRAQGPQSSTRSRPLTYSSPPRRSREPRKRRTHGQPSWPFSRRNVPSSYGG